MIRIDENTDIAHVIADMRRLARLTRRQTAEALDMSEQQYGQYERGYRVPHLATLLKIFETFGYDLALLPRNDA